MQRLYDKTSLLSANIKLYCLYYAMIQTLRLISKGKRKCILIFFTSKGKRNSEEEGLIKIYGMLSSNMSTYERKIHKFLR